MFLHIQTFGIVPYQEAIQWQMDWLEKKRTSSDLPEVLLLLEHEPVYTVGKKMGLPGKPLREIPLLFVQRSGGITYHGPGQLLLYTLVHLQKNGQTLKSLADDLVQVGKRFLRSYGLEGEERGGVPGIFVQEKLVAMIGLGSRAKISFHGMALNLNVDLAPFSAISPCGLSPQFVSNLKTILGKELPMEEAREKLKEAAESTFG